MNPLLRFFPDITHLWDDPEFRAGWRKAKERQERAVPYRCPRGCCISELVPEDDDFTGSGPSLCPHADDDAPVIRRTWTRLIEDHRAWLIVDRKRRARRRRSC